jgi:hypothetical protein
MWTDSLVTFLIASCTSDASAELPIGSKDFGLRCFAAPELRQHVIDFRCATRKRTDTAEWGVEHGERLEAVRADFLPDPKSR